MKNMRIQYFSDVHLEMYHDRPWKLRRFDIKNLGEYLVLAGDIGYPHYSMYEQFLETMSSMFKYVFVVSGNHEYYCNKRANLEFKMNTEQVPWMDFIDNQIRSVCAKFSNVVYLQNEWFDIPGTNVCVFGGTMWSDVAPDEERDIKHVMNDYKRIPGLTIGNVQSAYNTYLAMLQNAMAANPDKTFVVVSHHLPSYQLVHPRYFELQTRINSAFASEIPREIVDDPRILAWFAGHSHEPCESGKFHVNPIGYPGEKSKTSFNKVVDLFV